MSHRQSVRAIVIKDQSLLVMKRNKFGKVYYVLVGGGINIGENPEQALRRELREEAGMEVGAVRPVYMENGGPMYGVQYVYLCEYQGGEPQLSPGTEEATLNAMGQNLYEVMWLPFDQLLHVPFRSSSLQHAIAEALQRGFPDMPVELAWQPESVTQ